MSRRLLCISLAALLTPNAAEMISSSKFTLAGMQTAIPSPSAVVKPQTYVSLEPVPRGKAFEVAIVVEIARGFHMNSHKPTDPYLIPTTLTPQLPAGFELVDTIYPDGQQREVCVLAE